MRFRWLKNREVQQHFKVSWEPGKNNLADYITKHHTAAHHRQVRPIYIYDEEKSPKTVQGCIEILSKGPPKVQSRKSTPPDATPSTKTDTGMGLKLSHALPLTNFIASACTPHDPTGSILKRCRITTHTRVW